MRENEGRESAHVKSSVKDLSKVPNIADFVALFACITPLAPHEVGETEEYEPILIRDTDSLIAKFGDPRINPEKYIDLYTIMQIVNNGSSCYIVKVKSGDAGTWKFYNKNITATSSETSGSFDSSSLVWTSSSAITDDWQKDNPIVLVKKDSDVITYDKYSSKLTSDNKLEITFGSKVSSGDQSAIKVYLMEEPEDTDICMLKAVSGLSEKVRFDFIISQSKPQSLQNFTLTINVREEETNKVLNSVKVPLLANSNNELLVKSINSLLGSYASFELGDGLDPMASESDQNTKEQALTRILKIASGASQSGEIFTLDTPSYLYPSIVDQKTTFNVTVDNYKNALNVYKDKRYTGCLISELTAPVSDTTGVKEINHEDRRMLHYVIKEIASERKDLTAILSTPYKIDNNVLDIANACNWVASLSNFASLWEYGTENTTSYNEQSFYMEMYYSWLNQKCVRLQSGSVTTVVVPTAPAGIVIRNILSSFKDRGVQFPVAGDNGGVIDSNCEVIVNPSLKADRDKLISFRINPIYDTGTRGVQIYGNETLNAGYTDLNSAHIARTLVNIRSQVDEYTETLKFLLNNEITYSTWRSYVTTKILEPLQSTQGINTFEVKMGTDTTTPEEIANRIVKGSISLTFFQSAEIFDLTFVVNSSATAV